MTVLAGEIIQRLHIVAGGIGYKYDDGKTPSFGLDGAAYTFRIDPIYADGGKTKTQRKVIQPGESFVFKTFETVDMPDDCVGTLYIKSTYARQGLILVTNSMVDPGYAGNLTMRVFNTSTEDPITINMLGGLMQMIVHKLAEPTNMAYNGRHQGG